MEDSKRRDGQQQAADALKAENSYLGAQTLGYLCAAGIVTMSVTCRNCTRSGRYRVTRLIDRHGAAMRLVDLKPILAGDCRYRIARSPQDCCAVHYPGISKGRALRGL